MMCINVVSELDSLERYISPSIDFAISLPPGAEPLDSAAGEEDDGNNNTDKDQPGQPSSPPAKEIWVQHHEDGDGPLDPWSLFLVVGKKSFSHELLCEGPGRSSHVTSQAEIWDGPLAWIVIRVLNIAPASGKVEKRGQVGCLC